MKDLLRSEEMADRYKAQRDSGIMELRCVLCDEEAISVFEHWKIIPNKFPYDLIAKTHHMLIPLRHCIATELTEEEKNELALIKSGYVNVNSYDYILEPVDKNKSIPTHFHLHLIEGKYIK